MSPGDAAVSVCMSAGKVIAEQADRIAALEARVRELEAELEAVCTARDMLGNKWAAAEEKLTASRQQVERRVDAIDCCYRMLLSESDTRHALFKAENILREALAAVEKERNNEQS